MPGRKRIRAPASDSSDDDEQTTKRATKSPTTVAAAATTTTANSCLSVGDKEQRMRKVLTSEPDYESTHVHEALSKNDWHVDRALKYLRERCPKKKAAAHSSGGSASATSSSASSSQRSPQVSEIFFLSQPPRRFQ